MKVINEESKSVIRIRPRFQLIVSESIDEITVKINDALAQKDATCRGKISHGYGTIHLPAAEQHYWSPQLSISMEESEEHEGMTSIRGLYGPRPAVWTMFVFFYAIIAFAMVVIAIIGFSNMSLGESSIILWFLPFLFLLFLSLYLVAFFGQKLGHDQLIILHNFFSAATGISLPDD